MFIIGRRRALDRALDASMKKPQRRRRKADGIVCLTLWTTKGLN